MTFRDLIEQWPTRTALADDCGIPTGAVKQWHRRSAIPPRHWPAVVASARKHRIKGVTLTALYALAAKEKARERGESVMA